MTRVWGKKNGTENREWIPNPATLDLLVASYDPHGSYGDYLFCSSGHSDPNQGMLKSGPEINIIIIIITITIIMWQIPKPHHCGVDAHQGQGKREEERERETEGETSYPNRGNR